jgi:DNA (cytosine-5)-methyltransferase 1
MTVTVTDLFCGAGGSGLGATAVAGVELVMAANHWQLAVDTHQANFPDTDHDTADISQVEPRRYRRTSILWASPECTNHSNAKGKKRSNQPTLWDKPDPGAERSRATMWDVPRFAEIHRYDIVITENVVEAAQWEMFPAWLYAMKCLDYEHHIVWLNSAHAPAMRTPRAPQSRDRMYVCFWRRGNTRPDLEIRPPAWCPGCEKVVPAMQVFKPRTKAWPLDRWGRYGPQYVYRCPNISCRNSQVQPDALAAEAVLDLADLGERIGDKTDPLEDTTLERIATWLRKHRGPGLIPAGGTRHTAGAPITAPFRTRTTTEFEGILVPLEGREGKVARSTRLPMRTQSTRAETALVVPYYGNGTARDTTTPMPTQPAGERFGLAFISELRGTATGREITEPLSTVSAGGNHHALVTPTEVPKVEDCTFRMLHVAEVQAAMAFRPDYHLCGTSKRVKIRQLGNGVTPPAAEWLIRAAVDSLGEVA